MSKKIFLFVTVLGIAVLFSGCGEKTLVEKGIEKNIEKSLGGDAQVDLDSGAVNIQTKEGSIQVGGNIKLPEGFPTDVYLIEGKILSAMNNFVGEGYQVSVLTDKSIAEAKALYQEKLPADGWTIESTMDYGEMVGINAKKDGRQVSLVFTTDSESGQTSVVLTVTE